MSMLIKMVDGGLVNYDDDSYHYDGCPTCDYGSEYINEINITLTHYKVYVKTNKMYSHAISEGWMIKLFLSENNTIQAMTEGEFADWFREKLREVPCGTYETRNASDFIEKFEVTRI